MSEALAILVTRASPGAEETGARLRALGYTPILSPALTIAPLSPPPELALEDVGGILFTSANGVRAFETASSRRDLTAWCVGPATEAAAVEAGFNHIRCGHGDSDDLADLVLAAPPEPGVLLHLANAAAAGQLVARLTAAGREARFQALYETGPATALTDEALAAFASSRIAAVLVHSAKGAAGFAALAQGLDLTRVALVAVSEKSIAPVRDLGWRRVAIAEAPNETALLAALETALLPVSG